MVYRYGSSKKFDTIFADSGIFKKIQAEEGLEFDTITDGVLTLDNSHLLFTNAQGDWRIVLAASHLYLQRYHEGHWRTFIEYYLDSDLRKTFFQSTTTITAPNQRAKRQTIQTDGNIGLNSGGVISFGAHYDGTNWINSQAASSTVLEAGAVTGLRIYSTNSNVQDAALTRHFAFGRTGNMYLNGLPSNATTYSTLMRNATSGEVFWQSSSAKYKKDIQPVVLQSHFIYDLAPRTYTAIPQSETQEESIHCGYIAEEVTELDPYAAIQSAEGPIGINWQYITMALVEEVKTLRADIDLLMELGLDRKMHD